MSYPGIRSARRSGRDKGLANIADYVCAADIDSVLAFETARAVIAKRC